MNERMLRYVMERDFHGKQPKCLFCKRPLKINGDEGRRTYARKKPEIDHLDNNRNNNNYWNLALVHKECNTRKRTNTDYQIIAQDRVAENKKYVPTKAALTPRVNKIVKIGAKLHKLAKWYLKRELPNADAEPRPLEDMCDELAYLAQEKYGCGSQATMRRHLRSICRGSGKWEITYEGGMDVVSRRW